MWHVLVGPAILAASLAGDVGAQYRALMREYDAALGRWSARYDHAEGAALEPRYREWPGWSFAPRVLAVAEAHPDDPAAVDAMIWVVTLRDRVGAWDRELFPDYERALALLREHLRDPRIDAKVFNTVGRGLTPGSEAFLRAALDGGRDRETRARACLMLADSLTSRHSLAVDAWYEHPNSGFNRMVAARIDPQFLVSIRSSDPTALADEATRLYLRTEREFGDVVAADGSTFGDHAKAGLRELLTLSPGRLAPAIEGPGADGKPLSLRDHRGKVVVVIVSQPKADYLHRPLRDLLARHKGEPFAVLGVSVGVNRADLDAAIKAGDITWPCWWDGPNGPICSDILSRSVPPLFVLDPDGVIRARGGRVEDVEDTVDRLLGEMKGRR